MTRSHPIHPVFCNRLVGIPGANQVLGGVLHIGGHHLLHGGAVIRPVLVLGSKWGKAQMATLTKKASSGVGIPIYQRRTINAREIYILTKRWVLGSKVKWKHAGLIWIWCDFQSIPAKEEADTLRTTPAQEFLASPSDMSPGRGTPNEFKQKWKKSESPLTTYMHLHSHPNIILFFGKSQTIIPKEKGTLSDAPKSPKFKALVLFFP